MIKTGGLMDRVGGMVFWIVIALAAVGGVAYLAGVRIESNAKDRSGITITGEDGTPRTITFPDMPKVEFSVPNGAVSPPEREPG